MQYMPEYQVNLLHLGFVFEHFNNLIRRFTENFTQFRYFGLNLESMPASKNNSGVGKNNFFKTKKMRFLILITLPLLISLSATAQKFNGDKIIGLWMSHEKDLIVKCFKEDDKYFGTIVWYKKNQNNSTAAATIEYDGMPQEKWMNSFVMKDFIFDDDEWNDGNIYDVKSGKKYTAFVKLNNDNELHVTGYVCFRFLCQTMDFNRYTDSKLPLFGY